MSNEVDRHIDPEEMEKYAMGRASDEATARCEEHLLLCGPCRQSLEETDFRVAAMHSAARHLRQDSPRQSSWWTFPRWMPAFAAVGLLAIGLAYFGAGGNSQPPVAMTLTATRGAGIQAVVPAGRGLALTPDLTALPPATSYRLEIVDEQGRETWQGSYHAGQGAAKVPAQRVGTHFVRIYSASGELLREYGLEVKR